MKTTELKKDLNTEIENLKNQNELMRKLSTKKGFFESYFENLKNSESQQDAFNKTNNLYFKLFGEMRYNDYDIFLNAKPIEC